MKRISRATLALAFACTAVAGCASFEQIFEGPLVAGSGLAPTADRIAVYDGSPSLRQYRIVQRLWTGSSKSAFRVPRYASAEAGAADLRNQAVALGGDAIVNFACYGDARDRPAMICNGTVIKYDQ